MDGSFEPRGNARAAAMRLFALAAWPDLDEATRAFQATEHSLLRGPDTGLVMLRGRMGATGNAFNLGEMTVTRCAVKLASGTEGHAYIQGRNSDHARRAAVCDALFQESPDQLSAALTMIASRIEAKHREQATKAAATKVDFFTMVRGDD